MRLFMLSDLHLRTPSQPFYGSVVEVMKGVNQANDVLVLAGDIFDLFIGGGKEFRELHSPLLKALDEISKKGTKIFFIEGNHDFHIHSVLEPLGVTVSTDELEWVDPSNGKKIYIAHGDLVDLTDSKYLKDRAFYKSTPMKWIAQILPSFLILKIAEYYRRDENDQFQNLPEAWSKEKRERLRKVFREYAEQKKRQGFDFVLLGHCHDLDEWGGFYFNSGFPPKHRQYLIYESAKGLVERRYFSEPTA